MNILKPQKKIFEKLNYIENILEETKNNDEFQNIEVNNYKKENIEFFDITIEKSKFNNTDIIDSSLEKNTFIDVEFNESPHSSTG